MRIGILAVQGAFIEHEQILTQLGADCFEIRKAEHLQQPFDGLVLPGGESTVMGRLLKDLELFTPLQTAIQKGLPVLGTCAGLILLAEQITGTATAHLATMPITVKRNAYGRQLGSFQTQGQMQHVGNIPMTFIRAPYIASVGNGVEVLASVDEHIVAARYGNQIGLAFHPEVTSDSGVHRYFLQIVQNYALSA
jgi:5'-phosphate synthase pdxT subunit